MTVVVPEDLVVVVVVVYCCVLVVVVFVDVSKLTSNFSLLACDAYLIARLPDLSFFLLLLLFLFFCSSFLPFFFLFFVPLRRKFNLHGPLVSMCVE